MGTASTTGTRIKKFTTLEDLEKETIGPVYVLNNTQNELEGNIVISIPKQSGNGSDLVRVPKTFIPIDITLQASRSQLINSSELRKTVGKGLIKLVTKEYARLLLDEPEAKEEQRRLINEQNKAKSILRAAGVSEESPQEEEDDYITVNDAKAEVRKVAEKKRPAKPSPKVESLIAQCKADNDNVPAVLGKLRNVRTMTSADLAFISKEYSDKPRIIKYLKERLQEMREEANANN